MNTPVFYNKTVNKKELKTIIHSTFESYGMVKATNLVEVLKKSGFSFATQAGISISIEDLKVPPTKDPLFLKNNKYIRQAYFYEKRGDINEIERFQKVIDSWHSTSDLLKNQLVEFFKTMDPLNPVYIMAFSGARGNLSQVRQLVGMRGLMADPNGQIIDLPIKANFREGLTITDYVISSYGARKGIVDTALRTADSGYLTRRLVDVAQHIIIRELDCKTQNGIRIFFDPGSKKLNHFIGRVLVKPVFKEHTKTCLIEAGTTLTPAILKGIDFEVDLILRSPLICESSRSICQKCYGWNLSNGQLVELADAVGIIAAQSIGEPGTQLTMRTFHTGGVFTGESSNHIRAHSDCQVLFASDLQTVIERTIYGEIILKARNNTNIYLLANKKQLTTIPVSVGMLIFVKNKAQLQTGDLIAEIPQSNKQTIKQRKTVTSKIAGEIQFQNLRFDNYSLSVNNGLLWIASGEVHDLLPNMLVKKAGDVIIKNNAFAQSKITFPMAGFVKINAMSNPPNLAIVNNLFLLLLNSLYKNELGYYIRFAPNLFFQITSDFEQKSREFRSFGKCVRSSYTLPYLARLVYPKKYTQKNNAITKFAVCLLLATENNQRSYLKNASSDMETYFDKKLVFPGEIIFETIEISELSYCELELVKNQVSVKITPVKQCSISNPSKYYIKKGIRLFERFSIKFVTNVHLNESGLALPNQPFITTNFGFSNFYHSNTYKFIPHCLFLTKSSTKYVVFLIKYKFPTNINSLLNENRVVSYLISNNQYIDPYTVIATVSNIVKEKTSINSIKNSRFKPERFLISTSNNYKTYPKMINSDKFVNSNFVAIGDTLKFDGSYADYSGYIISNRNKDKVNIRISLPFFISAGARVLVKHGSLIQKDEPLCQLIYTRFVSDDIVTGLPRIENLLEARSKDEKDDCQLIENPGVVKSNPENGSLKVIEKRKVRTYEIDNSLVAPFRRGEIVHVAQPLQANLLNPHKVLEVYFKYYCSFYTPERATKHSIGNIQILLLNLVQDVYRSQGIYIADKHVEIIIRQITSKVRILTHNVETFFVLREFLDFEQVRYINMALKTANKSLIEYQPVLVGITKVSLLAESFVSAASFQETTRILAQAAIEGRVEWLRGLKENVILGRLIPAGTGFKSFNTTSLLNIRLNE